MLYPKRLATSPGRPQHAEVLQCEMCVVVTLWVKNTRHHSRHNEDILRHRWHCSSGANFCHIFVSFSGAFYCESLLYPVGTTVNYQLLRGISLHHLSSSFQANITAHTPSHIAGMCSHNHKSATSFLPAVAVLWVARSKLYLLALIVIGVFCTLISDWRCHVFRDPAARWYRSGLWRHDV